VLLIIDVIMDTNKLLSHQGCS